MSISSHEAVTRMVSRLLAAHGHEPELLLQHLIAVQQAFSYVPPAAVEALSAAMGVTRSRILASIDFYAFLHAPAPRRFRPPLQRQHHRPPAG
jgi:[NiFe] hydrogenase diaphorase moiety large subunit